MATQANEQPDSAFAIGATHFEVSGATPPAAAVDPASLWQVETGWQDFHLALRPGGAVDVRFRIPDGEYRLSVSFAGRGTVGVVGGALDVALTGPPPALELGAHKMGKKTVQLGEITIADRRFHARLESAEGGEGMVVRYFGFEPLGGGAERSEADLEAEERLRSLGYID